MKKPLTNEDCVNILANVISTVTALKLQYEILFSFDKTKIETIILNNKSSYFGIYFMEDEIQFFVHENIRSDKRYILECTSHKLNSYIYQCVNNTKEFIENYHYLIIDEI